MSEIKAIETVYNGYRFRSRLEARWAVFFDRLGVLYEYEKEGFDLGDAGWYLPDFWLPDQQIWVEIKPADFYPLDFSSVSLFWPMAHQSGHDVLLLGGNPWPGEYLPTLWRVGYRRDQAVIWPAEALAHCTKCGQLAIKVDVFGEGDSPWRTYGSCKACEAGQTTPCDANLVTESSLLMRAYTAARQARFEHGETPSI